MYRIVYTKKAAKELLKAPKKTAQLIRQKLALVAEDPYTSIPNAKKLQGRAGYRLRVGDWRVIYEVKNEEIMILVLKVAPRSEVYK